MKISKHLLCDQTELFHFRSDFNTTITAFYESAGRIVIEESLSENTQWEFHNNNIRWVGCVMVNLRDNVVHGLGI